jgi:MtN3 and saliva related transmembrane protein
MESWLATLIGTIAGICSCTSFVPQVLKVWRGGETEAISLRMYVVTVTAFCLWVTYGVLIGSIPVIFFNALSLALAATILVFKIRNVRRAARSAAE